MMNPPADGPDHRDARRERRLSAAAGAYRAMHPDGTASSAPIERRHYGRRATDCLTPVRDVGNTGQWSRRRAALAVIVANAVVQIAVQLSERVWP